MKKLIRAWTSRALFALSLLVFQVSLAAAEQYQVQGPASVTLNYAPPGSSFQQSYSSGYEYYLGGGIIVQQTDGAGNIVSAAHPMPMLCVSGCSGGTGGGGGISAAASTSISGSVSTANTFQTVTAFNASRKGCSFQNTSTGVEYWFFGPTGSATLANSQQVPAGFTIDCASPGVIQDDNIAVTGATVGQTFAGSIQ